MENSNRYVKSHYKINKIQLRSDVREGKSSFAMEMKINFDAIFVLLFAILLKKGRMNERGRKVFFCVIIEVLSFDVDPLEC